ncbi:MAG: response regulator [Nitrosarchaeum sp.]|nr:response regulator [Nitrosarchaeum sp.]
MKNILIIDDNKDITGLFKTILESAGHKCTAVHDGKKGLEMLHEKSFDLTLLDLAMPGMSGTDVLDIVKNDPKIKDSKILIITASSPSDAEMDRIRKEYRILDIVKKPINKAKLLQTIEMY